MVAHTAFGKSCSSQNGHVLKLGAFLSTESLLQSACLNAFLAR